MFLAGAGAILGCAAATLAYGVANKSSQLFATSVCRGPGRRQSIALTFDDGPSESTSPLLDYLSDHNISATFFQCGLNVLRLTNVSREVVARGHELGNHSWSHPKIYLKSGRFIDDEFSRTQHLLTTETGVTPTLLRPPYGYRWLGLQSVQNKLAVRGVLWTVIGNDWKWGSERIADHTLRNASAGGIICLHDGRDIQVKPNVSQMLSALRQLVPELQNKGYRFETVSQLLQPDELQSV
jgi:peptidoglycan/xylan/chitin deacetylase (PgdA/CDA1 family)